MGINPKLNKVSHQNQKLFKLIIIKTKYNTIHGTICIYKFKSTVLKRAKADTMKENFNV